MARPYNILGLGLCLFGAIFTPIAYFVIESVPFSALGIAALIIGFTAISLARTRPPISPEACELMLRTGMENTAALLEEMGIEGKAIYLPGSLSDGGPCALVPLATELDLKLLQHKIPRRLIVRYGAGAEAIGIAVTTPGSLALKINGQQPDRFSDDIENNLNYVLVGLFDIARSVAVTQAEDAVEVKVARPMLHYENVWYYNCLGSPLGSIVATVVAETIGKPVSISSEEMTRNDVVVSLAVLT